MDYVAQDETVCLVRKYFSYGFQHKEILAFLKILHKKTISYRTLKRILSTLGLYRRKNYSNLQDVIRFLQKEIQTSGQLHGYKWMHLKCIMNNLVVTQNVVRELLSYLDPHGVEIRKKRKLRRRKYFNKGPNYLWHVDSYDKLKPYGICINGCIDGFSRHIIWMKAGCTSNDPKIIAGYFLNSLKLTEGFPKSIRCDMGTENKVIENIQKTLHELFNERPSTKPPFIYGKSTCNQRIEAWWSILRKHNTQFWMNLFQMLKDENHFDGSFLDKSLIRFCFMDIIQDDLNTVVMEWNIHKVRNTKNSNSPSGRPVIMYEMPSLYSAQNYITLVPEFALQELEKECSFNTYPCHKDVYDLCKILMSEHRYHHTNDPYKAVDLYILLRNLIKDVTG